MSNDDKWTNECVTKAAKTHPRVTDQATNRMRLLLKGQLGERQLSRKELAETAEALVADMAAATMKAGHED